jgi:TolB-like protein/Flp pilus assembly protein TadD
LNGPQDGEDDNIWNRLRRRKVVQWGVAYAAGAWGFLQGLQYVSEAFGWPGQLRQVAILALLIGLPIVLVIAWYHGDRGEQRVSGTELAILTLLFVLGGGVFWRYEHAQHVAPTATPSAAAPASSPDSAEQQSSIAVLPFENRSAKQDDVFFVDGIHDDILTQLSKVAALKVISRTSVEQFRDTKLPTSAIAEQLGVNSILEGGVQRAGDRVRINVQLIDTRTDAHLWAETYDRELTAENIFAIQTELAAAIADALQATLTPAEKARAKVVPTRNLEAWESYQLGKQRLAKRTSTGLVEAEQFFRKAIDLDPNFALAYAGLADSLALRVSYSDTSIARTLEQAQAAVEIAMKLDPGLSEAWASSGLIADYREQTDLAERMYRRAIELNPNDAMAFKWYGKLLVYASRMDEGQRALERAASLDPLSAIVHLNLAEALELQGRFPEAASHQRRAIEIDPSMPGPYSDLGYLTAYALNDFAVAVPLVRKTVELDPGGPGWAWGLASMYLDLGDESRSLATTEQAIRRWPDSWGIQQMQATLDQIRRDDAAAVRHAVRSLALNPRNPGALRILRNVDLQGGRVEDALTRYHKAYPELFAQGTPRLDGLNYGVAVDLALALQMHGDTARARALLDAAAQTIGKIPRLGAGGYGITDVQIHALRGDTAKALAALREASKAGWRGPYWSYARDFDPALASIRNEPEFKAVFADIERDMARQRAELAARAKDALPTSGQPFAQSP